MAVTTRLTMGRILKSSLTAAAVVAVALSIGLATGAGAKGPGGYGPGARLERAIEGLQLDEAKRAEVFGVIDAARPAGRELGERMRAAREEMRALIADPSASEEAVLAKADTLGALHTEHKKHELRTLLQVRARLSAEQQAQLAEAMQKRHCGGGRHERRHVL